MCHSECVQQFQKVITKNISVCDIFAVQAVVCLHLGESDSVKQLFSDWSSVSEA